MKPSRKTPILLLAVAGLFFASKSFAQTGSDKVDVQALENKYWAAKDDDFSVVQNRAFSKKKRFFGTAHYGVSINDPYYSGTYLGISGGYFFNESWGVEGTYQQSDFSKSRAFNDILGLGGGPRANQFINRIGVNGIWTPIYAKMSLFDRKIIHFDMGFTFGLTQISYETPYSRTPFSNGFQETSKSNSTMGYTIGVMQQFYFRENMAIRVDFNNTFSTQKTVRYTSQTGASGGNRNVNDTSLLIGFTIFDWRAK